MMLKDILIDKELEKPRGLKILLVFEQMGMGDCLSAEPVFEALIHKYGANTELYIMGDNKNVHDKCPFITGPHREDIDYDLGITFAMNHDYESIPLVDQWAKIAQVKLERRTPSMYITEEEIKQGMEYLINRGMDFDKHIAVAFSTDCNNDYRRNWGEDKYCELCEKIREKYANVTIIDIGLSRKNPTDCNIHICDLQLRMAVSVLANCRLFIGTNRGMYQLAQMAGIPSIILFSITPPARTTYDGKVVIPVYLDLPCIFCCWKDIRAVERAGGCYEKKNNLCMDTLPVNMVWEKVDEYLSKI